MSQTPHPHDPYGTEPGTPEPQAAEPGSPTSDPAPPPSRSLRLRRQHPGRTLPRSRRLPPIPTAPRRRPGPRHTALSPRTAQQAPQSAPAGDGTDQPAPGTKGVYEGPLDGQPLSRSDSRMWGMFSQLAVVLGHVVSWGFLGWVGPLIIFLMYKDRDRFVRFHAAEALNGAIAVVIAQIVLTIAVTIFGVVTLGIGWALYPLVGLPALLQLIFSIIGAVKANQGEYWTYPVNLRLVK